MKLQQRLQILAAAAASAILFAACASAPQAAPESAAPSAPKSVSGNPAQAETLLGSFTTWDIDGNEATQDILAGKTLTMVNVWATFCGPCISEMPELGELNRTYADKNVQVVGLLSDVVNTDGTLSDSILETAHEIVEKTQADYLHIVPSQDFARVMNSVSAVPTTFFVDGTGAQVGETYVGARDGEAWAAIIDALLAEMA